MKRMVISLILAVLCCSFLVGCRQTIKIDSCAYCGAAILGKANYCSQCGVSTSGEQADLTGTSIAPEHEARINQAIDLLVSEWADIAAEDPNNNGYFEIKNTCLIELQGFDERLSEEIVADVDCIVEFILYTDYHGSAPYYGVTQYWNNVVFLSDGTSFLESNVVDYYVATTYDFGLDMITYDIVDYKDHFNRTINLKDSAGTEDIPSSVPSESSANSAPSSSAQSEYMILDSGRCNENIFWEIDSDGLLYIYGNGAVPSYESRDVDGLIAPWRASPLFSEITDVIIGDDVTGLGENLFRGMMLDTLYLGKNVRVFDYSGVNYFYARDVYIPKCFKDIYDLLCETSLDKGTQAMQSVC